MYKYFVRVALLFFLSSMFTTQVIGTEDFQYLPEVENVLIRPKMRPEPYSATIYSVLSEDLYKFIDNIIIYDTVDEYEAQPYIISFEENRVLAHPGQLAFTKGIEVKDDYFEYTILRPGKILEHPITKEEIGMEAFVNGRAEVQKFGSTQTLLIKDSVSVVEINARLIPFVGVNLPSIIDVKYPTREMTGYILSIESDLAVGGAYMPVTVSLGSVDCLKLGHVLDIVEKQREVTDTNKRRKVKVPQRKIGEVMIYKVGKRISLGVISYSDRSIVVGDKLMASENGL